MEIDLNADLGEGGPHDAELLTLVSSANISCGAHAGDENDIRAALSIAIERKVCIGAHPSYPDRKSMGRMMLSMTPADLRAALTHQLSYLQELTHELSGKLSFVKPHGALYNEAARNPELATLIADVIKRFDPHLGLTALAGSELIQAGQAIGLHTCAEAFVDRSYRHDGSLVPRSEPGALIHEPAMAVQQALSIAQHHCVRTLGGAVIPIRADTLCLHGDTPEALAFGYALRQELGAAGIRIRACHAADRQKTQDSKITDGKVART